MRFFPFHKWRGTSRRRQSKSVSFQRQHTRKLRLEHLETREMLSVNLGSINNIQIPQGKSVLVPLTGADSLGGPISYSFSASDSNLQLSLVSPESKSLVLNVSGTDKNGQVFSGALTLHLFEDLAPETTTRIEQLVTQGYYNGLNFFRILDGFMAQGGRSTDGNDTGVKLDDEINASLTFTSPGLLAMANAGPDTSDSEFFVTAIDLAGTTTPIPLAGDPQSLDYRYTIFGQLVSGFDTFEKIMSTTVTTNSSSEDSLPTHAITITSASIVDDTQDAVLMVTAPAGFAGTNLSVTVTAKNAANEVSQQSFNVTALEDTATDPPFLGPVTDQTTAAGAPVTFTLSSTDKSDVGVYYNAAIESGSTSSTLTVDNNSGAVSVTPTAGFVGDIPVIVGVVDAAQSTSYDTQIITVHVVAPTLNAVSNQSVALGQSDLFTLSANDPAGDGLIYGVVDVSTLAAPTNATVSIDQSTGQVTITPAAQFAGTLNLLARVRSVDSPDVASSYVTQPVTIDVVGLVLDNISDKSTVDGVPATFTLTANDAAATSLYYNLSGDTTNIDIVIDHNTGAVTVTPHAGFHGTVALTAAVRDASSPDDPENYVTQDFTFGVVSLNQVDDQATAFGTPVQITLTSNPSASGLHYAVFKGGSFEAPSNVTVSIDQTTGIVTLTPVAGFAGTADLRAAIRSADAVDDPSSYDWQDFELVVNVGPEVGAVADQTTSRGTPISVTLTSSDAPAGGVFYTLVDSSTNAAPANLTFTVDQQTGIATITPAPGFLGNISLRTAVRGASASDDPLNYDYSEPFELAVNDVPTMNAVSDQITTKGTSISFTATTSDATANGTFFNVFGADGSSAPENVTFTVDQQTGLVTLTPSAGFVGSETLQIGVRSAAAEDDPANYYLKSFVLTVNAGPALNLVTNQTTVVNAAVSFDLSATNVPAEGVAFSVVDASTLSAPTNVTVSVDANSHVVLTPVAGFSGTVSLLARVRGANAADDPLNYSTQAFTLTVTAPQLTAPTTETTALGVPVSFTLTSSNASGDEVRYAVFGTSTDVDVSIDATTGAVTLTPHDGFQGSVTFSAGVRDISSPDEQAEYTTQQIAFNVVSPTLSTVSDLTTPENTATTTTLSATGPAGYSLQYTVVDPTTLAAPSNVTISIDQSTGIVMMTPVSGFTGTVSLLARVRASGSNDVASNYVTQQFALSVTSTSAIPSAPTGLDLDSSSYTGVFDGNGYVTTPTVRLTVDAATGSTVAFSMNGQVIATGTETSSGSGVYTATLGAGILAVGDNAITAVAANTDGTSQASGSLNVTYAPDYTAGVYVVPGAPGTSVTINFDWMTKNASYNNEFGYFVVDSLNGTIDGIAPGEAGYAEAALSSSTRTVLFSKGQKAGATSSPTLQGGQMIVFYLIQNNTTANFLAENPSDTNKGNSNSNAPVAFFSVTAANPDDMKHSQITGDPTMGTMQYNWEDLISLGDSDFNDAVISVAPADTSAEYATLRSPGTGSTSVSLSATLKSGKQSSATGDVGVYFADDSSGTVDGLSLGDPGYAAAALASGNFQVLFAAGGTGTNQVTVPAGKTLAFYLIASGTTSDFLATNPTNTSGSVNALFSFDSANPDATNHFRWFSPEGKATNPNAVELHAMTKLSGGDKDFDAFALDLSFSSTAPTNDVTLNAVPDISEGGKATLTGTYTDNDTSTSHSLRVDWDDDNSDADSTFAVPNATSLTSGQAINSSTDSAVLTVTSIDGGQIGYSVEHRYLDDGPAGGNSTSSDISTITVTVTDGGAFNLSKTTTVTVNDSGPTVTLAPVSDISENGVATLAGNYVDSGLLDDETLAVNWGDPNNAAASSFSIPSVENADGTSHLTVGQTFNSGTDTAVLTITSVDSTTGQVGFSVQHQYPDDGAATGNSTTSDTSTISVTVSDDDAVSGANTTSITVNNVAPTISLNAVADTTVNATTTLTGTYTDIGLLDQHPLLVEWSDSDTSQVLINAIHDPTGAVTLTVGQTFNSSSDSAVLTITSIDASTGQVGFSLTHQYTAAGTDIAVTATVLDDDTGSGTASTTVTVAAAPTPTVTLNPISAVSEGATATLTGSFTDIVVTDTHTMTVDWGDVNNANDSTFAVPITNGLSVNQAISSSTDSAVLTITSVNTATGQVSFSVAHQYVDDGASSTGNSTTNDSSTVLTIVTGATAGTGYNNTDVTVNNVAPMVTLDPVSNVGVNDTVTLTGAYTDIGLADVHTLTINWDDPNTSNHATFTISGTSSLSLNETFSSSTDSSLLTIASMNTSTGEVGFSVQHVYAASSSPTVSTTVTDDDSGSGSDTVSFVVGSV